MYKSQRVSLLVLLLITCISSCSIDSVGYGGCDNATCYEISNLPANWQSRSSFSPIENSQQTFFGPEGEISFTPLQVEAEGDSVTTERLAQEYMVQFPEINFTQESLKYPHGDVILIQFDKSSNTGEVCIAVIPQADAQFIIAKGYSQDTQRERLCKILRESVPTYVVMPSMPMP